MDAYVDVYASPVDSTNSDASAASDSDGDSEAKGMLIQLVKQLLLKLMRLLMQIRFI